jgi:hypothetical protein
MINGQRVSMHDEIGGLHATGFHATNEFSTRVVGDTGGTTISVQIHCANQEPFHLGPMIVGSGRWGTHQPHPVAMPKEDDHQICRWDLARKYAPASRASIEHLLAHLQAVSLESKPAQWTNFDHGFRLLHARNDILLIVRSGH